MNEEILTIPSLEFFNNKWDLLLKYVKTQGNPPFHFEGNLDLRFQNPKSLGTLVSVSGDLDLEECENIKSLGKLTWVGGEVDLDSTSIRSLGELTNVGKSLDLRRTKIKTLSNLKSVGDDLFLMHTPIVRNEFQIRRKIYVGGIIKFNNSSYYNTYG